MTFSSVLLRDGTIYFVYVCYVLSFISSLSRQPRVPD